METQPNTFTVQWTRTETPQMKLISMNVSQPWVFIPGQVAVLGIPGIGESYYAIASAPEDNLSMEFLVKNGQGVAKALYETKKGDPVNAKGPVGKGFPIDQYRGRDFLLAAVGSAFAPMRGVIRSICKRRQDFGKIILIYGARYPADFPFLSEINDWKKANIEVILSASHPEGTPWNGASGHVQAHFERNIKELKQPVALICGMKAMQQESRDDLIRLGVLPDEILTNY